MLTPYINLIIDGNIWIKWRDMQTAIHRVRNSWGLSGAKSLLRS
jgi:hypothetical protein